MVHMSIAHKPGVRRGCVGQWKIKQKLLLNGESNGKDNGK